MPRRVVTFDNAGVGGSTGTTPSTITRMAIDAIAFVEAMELDAVDVLGFSIGSFVAQEIALIRPAIVRRLVLASSAPQGAAGMHGWAPEVIGAVGAPAPNPDGYLSVLFARSTASRQALSNLLGDATYSAVVGPDSAHGFLFQHHAEFAADVDGFLAGARAEGRPGLDRGNCP
jgi:pimeloyl-ACP methyl ester carboxylesterase